mgnify:CR=1 FL=1
MVRSITLLFAIGFCVLSGCRKDQAPVSPAGTADTASSVDSIRIGDSTDMNMSYPSLVFYPPDPMGSMVTKKLDLDNDGTDDISFTINASHTLMIGSWNWADVHCLVPDVAVLGYYRTDTLFGSSDTLFIIGPGVPPPYTVEFQTTVTNGCRLAGDAEVLSISPSSPHVVFPVAYDQLDQQSSFVNGDIPLMREPYGYGPNAYATSGDTIFTNIVRHEEGCVLPPLNTSLYIGFAIGTAPAQLRLGWIRLRFEEYHMIRIEEIAIQQ